MKITFIRHSKVLFNWDGFYDAASFVSACDDYDNSPVQSGGKLKIEKQPVYILIRTEQTRQNLFQREMEVIKTALLNEIPINPFLSTKFRLPIVSSPEIPFIRINAGHLAILLFHRKRPQHRSEIN